MSANFFSDILRSFLGLPQNSSGDVSGTLRSDFRNPIWNVDDDEDAEDELSHNFSNSGPNIPQGFLIYNDPIEMHRYFEKQISDVMKSFGGMAEAFIGMHQFPSNDSSDFMSPSVTRPAIEKSIRDDYIKPGYSPKENFGKKNVDSDLDSEITPDKVLSFFDHKESSQNQAVQSYKPTFFGQTIIVQTVTKADGSSETRRTIRDSSGTETTTITTVQPDDSITKNPTDQGSLDDLNIWKKMFNWN